MIVVFIGFSDWWTAVLLMIFGFIHLLGIDIQQVSIFILTIALGLLVDDPLVANVAMHDRWPPVISPWLGATILAKAIFFVTFTKQHRNRWYSPIALDYYDCAAGANGGSQ
ncbi:hypothetical protein [Microbulbifer spongiae]|uniref:Uncharacterized protein n=1 Tax=Microbulbifer spongiae TaxID=2944933 RepID=A0ABY9EH12_9GAMM|nr:hypothetical protein [Microbulbifer sp. MI-G]WKD51423.1 hypothetical protein M8T91_08375 [Microbulbifer sp. MI-G]